MSFNATWLDLREPADMVARAPGPMAALAAWVRSQPRPLRALDLGCGTGSTLRAIAPLLGEGQDWVLVDHDAALLAGARQRLLRWGGVEKGESTFGLAGAGWSARVQLVLHDLRWVEELPLDDRTLVTASALLDLVSRPWLVALAKRLRGRAFYAALTFDGEIRFFSPDPEDAALHEAFLAHQRRDKGFGPALGPDAASQCCDLFGFGNWRIEYARSDWVLGEQHRPLQSALLEGYAAAVAEQDAGAAAVASNWLKRRQAALDDEALRTRVGHSDLLALPLEAKA